MEMDDLTLTVVMIFLFFVVTGVCLYIGHKIGEHRRTAYQRVSASRRVKVKHLKREFGVLKRVWPKILVFLSSVKATLSVFVFSLLLLSLFVSEWLSVRTFGAPALASHSLSLSERRDAPRRRLRIGNPVKFLKRLFPARPKKSDFHILTRLEKKQAEMYGLVVQREFKEKIARPQTKGFKLKWPRVSLRRIGRKPKTERISARESLTCYERLIGSVARGDEENKPAEVNAASDVDTGSDIIECYGKLMGVGVGHNGNGKARRGGKKMTKELRSFRVSWILFWGLAVTGIGLLFWKPPLGLVVFGLTALYLGTCLHEVKAPNVGMLYKRGEFVATLKPGWYLTIPHFWNIESVNTSWLQKNVEGEMYTQEKTAIFVRGRIFFKASIMSRVLKLSVKEMESRAEVLGLSALRAVIGRYKFADLVSKKLDLEDEATQLLKKEFSKYGYTVWDLEIYDFDEKVWSEAERTRALGKARGEAAEALAKPLKDNYPAAMVSAIGTLAETAAQIAQTVSGKSKSGGGKKASSSGSTSSSGETEDVDSKIGTAINKLLGRS